MSIWTPKAIVCEQCRYDLSGIEAETGVVRCPECGYAQEAAPRWMPDLILPVWQAALLLSAPQIAVIIGVVDAVWISGSFVLATACLYLFGLVLFFIIALGISPTIKPWRGDPPLRRSLKAVALWAIVKLVPTALVVWIVSR